MATALYFVSYLIGLTSGAACVLTTNYKISVIFPGEYITVKPWLLPRIQGWVGCMYA